MRNATSNRIRLRSCVLLRSCVPLFSFLILLSARASSAATYHVSNSGSDEADGLSPDRAWATLDRVNTGPFVPGDRILFRRGDSWRGQLVPWSGSDSGPVTYGAYGNGNGDENGSGRKPLFLGSVSKSRPADWTSEGDRIWSAGGEPRAVRELLSESETDTLAWQLYCEGGAAVSGARGDREAHSPHSSQSLECRNAGKAASDVQLYLSPFPIERGKLYRVSFRAKCTKPFRMRMPVLMKAGKPWTAYGAPDPESREVGADWTHCTALYRSHATAADGRLTFFLGGALEAGAVLRIDDIGLAECDASGWLATDVGNIIFDEGTSCGVKVWEEKDLRTDGDFWYDELRHVVKLRSRENPTLRRRSIECALREHIIDQSGRSWIVYEDLELRYGAAHGIGGGNTHHVVVRRCDFAYIGGGDQNGGDWTVRFGNGIEFWGAAHDHLVEYCRLWEIYDAALTNQSGGPKTPQHHIVYRYNLIWNSEYSFEYWNRPEDSETHDIAIVHNTCVGAGHGWGHGQRPDPSGRHLCFYSSAAPARRVIIRGNIFCESKSSAFYAPGWSRAEIEALELDDNAWYRSEGVLIEIAGSRYTMADFAAYQSAWSKEPHSICAFPGFRDEARLDFRLSAASPCIDRGGDVDPGVDLDGIAVPRGKASDMGAFEFAGD